MKILFVGGGRRVSLAKRFKNFGFEVISYEIDNTAPIKKESKLINGLKWKDEDIIHHLSNIIIDENINLVLPLQDQASAVCSQLDFKNKIVSSNKDANEICLNKIKFENFILNSKFNYIYPKGLNTEKIIVKPLYGSNSKGIKVINFKDLNQINDINNFVVQNYIENGKEISVDCYFDKKSKMIDCVPRLRLEVQGGEVSKSITLIKNYLNISNITKEIGEELRLVGPACFQYILSEDKQLFIMEINSRFGGGVVLSLESGFNIIDLIKNEWILNKENNDYVSLWKENFGMNRYFEEFFYE